MTTTLVSVSLVEGVEQPVASVGTLDSGEQFIALRIGPALTVMLPGLGATTAAYAQRLASTLIEAAAACTVPSLAPPEMPVPEADFSDTFI